MFNVYSAGTLYINESGFNTNNIIQTMSYKQYYAGNICELEMSIINMVIPFLGFDPRNRAQITDLMKRFIQTTSSYKHLQYNTNCVLK